MSENLQHENRDVSTETVAVSAMNSAVESRRRFVGKALAVPAVLAVTGRSAMATGTQCALSPLAWISIHPNGGAAIVASHTVQSSCDLGCSPGGWLPNCGGSAQTFQWSWPVAPCSTLKRKLTNGSYQYYSWSSTYLNAKGISSSDPGWAGGATFPAGWGSYSGKVISRMLLDSSPSGVQRHICAAYLNAKKYPGYAVSLSDVQKLATYQPIGGHIFTDSQIKTFLDQTWS